MAELFLDGCKLYHHLPELNRFLAGEDIAPIHVEISPTNACNMRCVFCYADHSDHRMGTLKREPFVNLIRSMATMKVKSCLLAGDGEPLVNPATVEAIELGHSRGIDMALNSNGLAMSEEIGRRVLPCLTWLRFSVMSPDRETYGALHGTTADAFDTVIGNIGRCVEIKRELKSEVTIGVQQVLLPENAADTARLAELVRGLGVDYFVVKPFSIHPLNKDYQPGDIDRLPEQYRTVLEQAQALSDERFRCIIRWQTFSDGGERDYDRCLGLPFISQIASDGGVYSCCPFFGQERFCYGNINREDYQDIWNGPRRRKVMEDIARNIDVHRDCMSYCRHHQINRVLWDLTHQPIHVNFI